MEIEAFAAIIAGNDPVSRSIDRIGYLISISRFPPRIHQ